MNGARAIAIATEMSSRPSGVGPCPWRTFCDRQEPIADPSVEAPHAGVDGFDARQRRRQRPSVRTDRIQQRLERLEASDRRELAPAASDLEASSLAVSRQKRVSHRRLQRPLVRVPVRGAPMELRERAPGDSLVRTDRRTPAKSRW